MPLPIIAVVVVVALLGVGAYVMRDESVAPETVPVAETNTEEVPAPETSTLYTDGVYSATGSYFTPARTEHIIDVTLTVENDIITDATVVYDGAAAKTASHTRFDNAYKAAVIGASLETLSLSRVGGASLTSESFNDVLADVRAQAS